MMGQSDLIQQGIFLDTNVLHYLRVYLDVAKQYGLKPYGPLVEWSVISARLIAAKVLPHQRDGIRNGFNSFCYLEGRADADDRIIVSRLVLAEITHGLVEGQAHLNMASTGMPYQMRQSATELKQTLTAWISQAGFDAVRMATNGLIPELETQLHIHIWQAGVGSSDREVLTLLESLLKLVYFDVIDAWLYAESLIEQARSFVTFDSVFRNSINWIHNPGSAPHNDEDGLWKQARSGIQSAVAAVLLASSGDEAKIVLPQGVGPRNRD